MTVRVQVGVLLRRIAVKLGAARGAIDLVSMMVAVIVIGIISAVLSVLVFAVIPWSQDRTALQSLDAVRTAESIAFAMGVEQGSGKYVNAAELSARKLLPPSGTLAIETDQRGSCWVAIVTSATGARFCASNVDTPQRYATTQISECSDLSTISLPDPPTDEADPTPTGPPTGVGTLTVDTTVNEERAGTIAAGDSATFIVMIGCDDSDCWNASARVGLPTEFLGYRIVATKVIGIQHSEIKWSGCSTMVTDSCSLEVRAQQPIENGGRGLPAGNAMRIAITIESATAAAPATGAVTATVDADNANSTSDTASLSVM